MKVTKSQAEKVGHKIGIRFAKKKATTRYPSLEEFRRGMIVEYEHGKSGGKQTNVTNNDPVLTARITLAHLREHPYYYKKLAKYVEGRKNPLVGLHKRGPWVVTAVELWGSYHVYLTKDGVRVASASFKKRDDAQKKYKHWMRLVK